MSCPVSVLLYVQRDCGNFACVRECFFLVTFFFLSHCVHHCATLVPASSMLVCSVLQGCHPLIFFFRPPFITYPSCRRGEVAVNDNRGSYPTLWELKAICFFLCGRCVKNASECQTCVEHMQRRGWIVVPFNFALNTSVAFFVHLCTDDVAAFIQP